jgi:preprotein translocase subunit SecB
MKTSPLQLNDAFIGQVSIKPSDRPLAAIQPTDIRVDATPSYARHTENPLRWTVQLSVKFGAEEEKSIPYDGSIECEGYFTIVESALPEEKQRKLVAVNGATILYSTASEVIATLTARGRHGKFLLPSVSFIDQVIRLPDDPAPETPPSSGQAATSPTQTVATPIETKNPPSGNSPKDVS